MGARILSRTLLGESVAKNLKTLNVFRNHAIKNFVIAATLSVSLIASTVTPSIAFAATPATAPTTAEEQYSNPSTLSEPEVEVDQANISFDNSSGQNIITATSNADTTSEKPLQVFRSSDNQLYAIATSGRTVSFSIPRTEESYYATYGTSQSAPLAPFAGQDLWSINIASDKQVYKEAEYFTISGNVTHPDNGSTHAIYVLDKNDNIVSKSAMGAGYSHYATTNELSAEFYAVIAKDIAYPDWYGKKRSELTDVKDETSRVFLTKNELEISIAVDKTEIKTGERATISYTLNYPFDNSSYQVYFIDEKTGEIVQRNATNNPTPATVYFYDGDPRSYKAYIAPNDVSWGHFSQITNIVSESNSIEINKAPWSISLHAEKDSFKVGEYGRINWQTNHDTAANIHEYYRYYAIYIYDKTERRFVTKTSAVHTGYADLSFPSGGDHEYVAFVAKNMDYQNVPYEWNTADTVPAGLEEVKAISNAVSLSRVAWDVSLSVDKTSFDPDETVNFTVTPNQSIEKHISTYYGAAIVDVSTGNIIAHNEHWAGTLQTSFVSLFNEGSTREYKVYIGKIPYNTASKVEDITEIQAISNSISLTKKPWSVAPKIGIYTENYDWYQEPMHYYNISYVSTYQNSPNNPFRARLYNITEQKYMPEGWGHIGSVRIWTKLNDKNEYKWILGKFDSEWTDTPTLLYYETESPSFTLRSAGGPLDPYETAGGSNPSEECNQGCHGDPINAATGEFWDTQQDLVIPQNGPLLGFMRSFSTMKNDQDKGLGYGWTHNYDMRLRALNSDNSDATSLNEAAKISVVQENGSESLFTKMPNGSYQAPLRVKATLSKNADGSFTFIRKKQDKFIFDGTGKLTGLKDRNDNSLTLTYTADKLTRVENSRNQSIDIAWANNHISQVSDHSGRVFKYNYDNSWNLTSTENPAGTVINYTYDSDHRVLSLQNALGGTTTNTYTGDKIATQTDPRNNTLTFTYSSDSNGSTTEIAYPDGTVVNERYTKDLQLAQKTTTKNNQYSYEAYKYSADGSLWKLTNSNNHSAYFTYDLDGNMISSQDAIGYVTHMTYDDMGNLLTTTNAAGDVLTNTYDAKSNPLSTTSFEGRKKTYTINPDGTLATIVSEKGNVVGANPADYTTTYGYNSFGYLSTLTDANGAVSTIETDALGRAVRTVTPEGNAAGNNPNDYDSMISYDAMGNITSTTDEKENVTSTTYDAMGNVLTATNALGKVTSFTYDNVGNLLTSTNALGKTTHYEYDNRNRLIKITDPAGKISEIFYDSYGNVNRTKDTLGREKHQEWNPAGQMISSTDEEGKKTEYTYDPNGKLLTSKDPLGNISTYTYDILGRLSTSKDAENRTSTMSYTKDSLVSSVLRADGLSESSVYDIAGNAVSSTDASGKVQTWAYDNLNRKVNYTNATSNSETYSYDLSGEVLTNTRTDGSVVAYGYDKQKQLTSVDYPGTDMDISYTYDALGRKLTEQKGTSPAIEYAYNDIGHLVSRGPPGAKVAYTYDDLGNMSSMTYPSGRVVNYDYDDASQLTSLDTTGLGTVSYSYNNRGLQTDSTLPSGVKTNWTYDDAGRSTGFTVKNNTEVELYKKNYTFTPAGNIAQQGTTGATPTLNDFTYDPLSRLTEQKKNADGSVVNAYEYSATGNLTKNNSVIQTFDDAGKVLTSGTKAFGYDNRGNRASTVDSADTANNVTYAWNEANLLESQEVTKNNATVGIDYAYSADGLLASRDKDGQNTNNFVWDASGSIPLLLDDGVHEYIYGNGRTPIAQIAKADGTVIYLHSDTIGSVMASTDSSGTLVANTEYSPYGVNLGLSLSSFGFAGEWTDPDTNHSYLRARWLDTTTGTFLSRDPMVQQTHESYGYTGGNPLTRIDPLGLTWVNPIAENDIRPYKALAKLGCIIDWATVGDVASAVSTAVAVVGVAALAGTFLLPALGITGSVFGIVSATATITGWVGFGLTASLTVKDCWISRSEKDPAKASSYAQDCGVGIASTAFSAIPLSGQLVKPIKAFEKATKAKPNWDDFVVESGRQNQNILNAQIGWTVVTAIAPIIDIGNRKRKGEW